MTSSHTLYLLINHKAAPSKKGHRHGTSQAWFPYLHRPLIAFCPINALAIIPSFLPFVHGMISPSTPHARKYARPDFGSQHPSLAVTCITHIPNKSTICSLLIHNQMMWHILQFFSSSNNHANQPGTIQ